MENGLCKICGSKTQHVFTKRILDRHDVAYFKCECCGFLQTEKPHWFQEAYSSAITSQDVGLVNRNIQYSNLVEKILYKYYNISAKFMDFAGGYGMFTRIMRDKGFDFFHEDKYCDNLFAKYFSKDDLPEGERKFELITSFELMEHVENPHTELDYIFSMTNSFLFSTELIPSRDVENWWYLGLDHGQHISFYTKKSLEKIAEKYGKVFYSNGCVHLITDKKNLDVFKVNSRLEKIISKLKVKFHPQEKLPTKTQRDFEYVRMKIKK